MKKLKNIHSGIIIMLIVVLFILLKQGYLNLPFYWDEAWSYATAVFDMAEKGPTLLPGNVNPDLTRGHPLLFYFLSALWVKLFGTSLITVHIFPLIISTVLLIVIYFVSLDLSDKITAIAATVLFTFQSVFLAQSTMLLPEVMLSLWTLLAFYTYVKKKWGLFILFSVLLVMTKETGIVLIGTLFIDKIFLERLFVSGKVSTWRLQIRELLFMGIPVIVFIFFMTLQKLSTGWFLYPDHLKLAIDDPVEILHRILIFLSRLLFVHGRNIFFFLLTGSFVYLKFTKQVTWKSAHLLFHSMLFILFYNVFSSVNFFTTRYLLSILPIYILIGTWLIVRAFQKMPVLKIIALIGLAGLFAYYTFIGNGNAASDTSLAFRDTVLLQKQAVNYAEDMQWQHKSIYSAFLMQYYLSDPDLGYLNNKTCPFKDIGNKLERKYDIYVFCSNENDPMYAAIANNMNYTLIEKFENKGAWVEFFMRKEE